MKPANDAVDGLGKTIQRFKSEQVGQARTVNFFVKELTEITGLSREAAGAVGGLGQVMLEAASGGGAFAIGFEAVKLVLGQIVTEWRRAGEELKSVERIQQGVTDAMMAGKEALEKYSGAIKTAGDKAFADVLSAATESIKGVSKELDDLRAKGPGVLAYIRLAFKDTDMIDAFEERVRKASLAIEQIINRASNQADIARALAQEGQRAAQAGAANRVLADDYTKARERAAKAAAQEAREQARISALIGSTMDRMGDSASADRGNFPDMFYSQATADSLKAAEDGRNAPVFGPGNDIGAADFAMKAKEMAAFNAESSKTSEIFGAIGESIGSAFSSIGQIVGGAAGAVLKVLGQMIQQAVQLAISLAMASHGLDLAARHGRDRVHRARRHPGAHVRGAVLRGRHPLRPEDRARDGPPGRADHPCR